jgi:threonine dehydrogenase-like Zn-dependent dehydrogenase
MKTMRVAAIRDDRFVVEERPLPEPGPGEVLVKVRACGVCGSDLHYFHHVGELIETVRAAGLPVAEMERNRRSGPVLGHEFVCEIVDFGKDTQRRLEAGQRVCAMPFLMRPGGAQLVGASPEASGGFAEHMLLTEALCRPVEDQVPDAAAALAEPLAIAVHAANKARLTWDCAPVIVGCGPIGLALIAVLKARGVASVIASDLSPARRALARRMGAATVIDPAEGDVIAAAVEARAGAPLVIFESTGARGMLHRLIMGAPTGARIVGVGIPPGEESFLPMMAIIKEIELVFVIYYAAEEFAEAMTLARDGAGRAMITGAVGLDSLNQAFAALSDPETHAKIIVEPWRDGGL